MRKDSLLRGRMRSGAFGLVTTLAIVVGLLATAAPALGATLVSDNFDTTPLAGGWTRGYDGGAAGLTWGHIDWDNTQSAGGLSLWVGGYGSNPNYGAHLYVNNMASYLRRTVDLSVAVDARVVFNYKIPSGDPMSGYPDLHASDVGFVNIYPSGSGIRNIPFTVWAPEWAKKTISLRDYAGDPSVQLEWKWVSDGSGVGEGWYIDNVVVEAADLAGPAGFTVRDKPSDSGSYINLSWTASPETDVVYKISRAPYENNDYVEISSQTETAFTDTVLDNNHRYFYHLQAVKGGKRSFVYDGSAAAYDNLNLYPPLSLASYDLPGDDGGKVELIWEGSPSDNIDAYQIFRRAEGEGAFTLIATVSDTARHFVDTSATNGVKYYYALKGAYGAFSSGDSPSSFATAADNPPYVTDVDFEVSPTSVKANNLVLLTGTVTTPLAPDKNPKGERVTIRYRPWGATWQDLTTVATNLNGSGYFGTHVRPARHTDYKVYFAPGDQFKYASALARTVYVRSSITMARRPSSVRRGSLIKFWGTVSPNHRGKLTYMQILTSRGWRNITKARLSSSSKYVMYYRPRVRGRLRFRAVFRDTDHLTSVSASQSTLVTR